MLRSKVQRKNTSTKSGSLRWKHPTAMQDFPSARLPQNSRKGHGERRHDSAQKRTKVTPPETSTNARRQRGQTTTKIELDKNEFDLEECLVAGPQKEQARMNRRPIQEGGFRSRIHELKASSASAAPRRQESSPDRSRRWTTRHARTTSWRWRCPSAGRRCRRGRPGCAGWSCRWRRTAPGT